MGTKGGNQYHWSIKISMFNEHQTQNVVLVETFSGIFSTYGDRTSNNKLLRKKQIWTLLVGLHSRGECDECQLFFNTH